MIRLLLLLLMLLVSSPAAAQTPACTAPPPVCALASRVFRIASFDPEASAVLIASELLVTNRHVVADSKSAQVFLPSGGSLPADVVPTSYPGDLILLRVPGLKATHPMPTAAPSLSASLYSIGADTKKNRVRVYKPGRVKLMPAQDKPLARLHHDAYSQPGNSGGALVDSDGRLVAIIASGGEGRFEAIPAGQIARPEAMSGPAHEKTSGKIGGAVRACVEALETARIDAIREICPVTKNRQLWDVAGQKLGRRGLFDEAVGIFTRALNQDPNAVNSMLSMAVTLHLAGRYIEEIPHLRRLLGIMPSDAQVLRLSIQAGVWGADKELARAALKLLQRHHPTMAGAAGKFIESNPPPPKGRQGGNRPR